MNDVYSFSLEQQWSLL